MTFSIEELNLSDAPIEGLEEAFDNWQEAPPFAPPPEPGPLHARFAIDNGGVVDGVLKLELTFTVVGGNSDGGRIPFQRVSSKLFERRDGTRTSQVMDILHSAGVAQSPKSLREIGQQMTALSNAGSIVSFQHDWRGACADCYKSKLRELTGSATDEEAKAASSKEQRKAADKFAVKYKNWKAFPIGPNGEKLVESKCPACGGDIRAQSNIVRYLKAQA